RGACRRWSQLNFNARPTARSRNAPSPFHAQPSAPFATAFPCTRFRFPLSAFPPSPWRATADKPLSLLLLGGLRGTGRFSPRFSFSSFAAHRLFFCIHPCADRSHGPGLDSARRSSGVAG